MPTKIYYLDATRTNGVTASWNLFFRNFRLDYQGQELGWLSPAELKAGHTFTLPDGRRAVALELAGFIEAAFSTVLDATPKMQIRDDASQLARRIIDADSAANTVPIDELLAMINAMLSAGAICWPLPLK
jgi:hypothetical protein